MLVKSALLPAIMCLLLFWPGPIHAEDVLIQDVVGRQVTAPKDPERILCLAPGALRLIVYLQAQDKLVGVEAMEKQNPRGRPYWFASPGLKQLPICGPGGPASIDQKPNMELVLDLDPQAIFVTYMNRSLADRVQKILDIPVIVLSYGPFANFDQTVFKSLRLAGRVLNREQRALDVEQFIRDTQKDLQQKAKQTAQVDLPKVYAGGIGKRGAHGLESTQQNYPPLQWIQAHNLAREISAGDQKHLFISMERLLGLDPEFIFIDGGGLQLVEQDFKKKPEIYTSLQAFQKGRVYTLHPVNWYLTNIGTALANAYAVGKIIYPKAFAQVDVSNKADQIYEFLLGAKVNQEMERDYGKLGDKPRFIP